MNRIYAECTVEAKVPETKVPRTFAAQFSAEQEQSRKTISRLGGQAITWLGSDWVSGKNGRTSLHKWAIECDEVALTALTLTCHSVTLLAKYT